MKKPYCEWWDVPLEDVAEWQQEKCEENEMHCENCSERNMKEDEETGR